QTTCADIFDSGGQLLDTDFTYIYLDNLPAGSRTCFNISLKEPLGWSTYELATPTYWTDGRPLPDLTILGDSGAYNPDFGWYEIGGQVRNDHGSRVEQVRAAGTLYNGSGVVVGCGFAYVDSTHLDPGQTSAFEMGFYGRDYADVTAYRLQADGKPQ
ncbi:MAG: hypothetical protein H8E35_14820, partial [Ardenticatenia bacterium]|nr:hypothetical protein [Ardenticatenia bacterium]